MNLNKIFLFFLLFLTSSHIVFSQTLATSGIRITGEFYFNSTTNNYYVLDELVNIGFKNNVRPIVNLDSGEFNTDLDKPYITNINNVTLYAGRGVTTTILGHSGTIINSRLQLQYDSTNKDIGHYYNNAGLFICNEFGGCSPYRTNSQILSFFSSQIDSGIKINTNPHFNSETNNYYILDELVNIGFKNNVRPIINLDSGEFNTDLDKPYITNINNVTLYAGRGVTTTILGHSGTIINSRLQLQYDSTNKDIGHYYNNAGLFICNEFGGCSPYRTNSQILSFFSSQIDSGIKINTNPLLQILTSTNPLYVNPTPQKNLKTTNLSSIIIRISDNGNTLESCQVIINEQPFEMPYQDNHCEYTYNITQTNNINEITFQGLYNITGTQYELEKRTVTLYPPNNTNKFPSISIVSILIVGIMMLFL